MSKDNFIYKNPEYEARVEKWHRRYLGLAKYYSQFSKDPSTKVGAVLVSAKNRVVGVGYNGFPPGVEDTEERLNNRELKYKLVVHAEVNAIISAGDKADGATLYVYPSFALPPICNECCKVAITAGIDRIVGFVADENDERAVRWKDSIAIAKLMCNEANIQYTGLRETIVPFAKDELLKLQKFIAEEIGRCSGDRDPLRSVLSKVGETITNLDDLDL